MVNKMKSLLMSAFITRVCGNVYVAALINARSSVLRLGCKLLNKSLYKLLIGILAVTSVQALADSKLHDKYNSLLNKHVVTINDGASTQVNYEGFKRDQKALSDYLNQLAAVPPKTFGSWDENTQLAFLINAYNAYTINLILTEYPSLDSIRDLGGFFSSPWKKDIAPLLGKSRSLDDIEHNLIRGDNKYSEPRIHFAVNCASVGCPALREEAYIGEQLDKQLEDQTKRFLGDSTRNTMKGNTLYLSKIFTWYEGDFEKNWKGTSTVKEFIVLYREAMSLNQSQVDAITSGEVEVDYLDYDWSLNDVKP
ncbi:DUF547 domain-containing protein [Alteromonas hispanica]|uniref:DUF547 domain-containing protein n=2 Tax=Alteromonas hispanica TaxID=315421 RepID=A0A6L9MVR2_9ALTE|nr:DUF547 domain-containing protein [Alteromonas hispanica]